MSLTCLIKGSIYWSFGSKGLFRKNVEYNGIRLTIKKINRLNEGYYICQEGLKISDRTDRAIGLAARTFVKVLREFVYIIVVY